MIAGVLLIVVLGVLIERGLLDTLEKHTVVRWGMRRQAEALSG
ncbi:MAG: hypothetical protein KatS3mg131_2286 [Candidatus Tectimicrobiota bacterium]|nr:MAG: hypothetical protein KatS3mg131_2286 [Candidatus Tectomicrobia bacterium]